MSQSSNTTKLLKCVYLMTKVVFDTVIFPPVLFVAGQIVACSLGYEKNKLHVSGCEMKLKVGESQAVSLFGLSFQSGEVFDQIKAAKLTI